MFLRSLAKGSLLCLFWLAVYFAGSFPMAAWFYWQFG